jgi:hypothetical protein
MDLLSQRITSHLQKLVGLTLVDVDLFCLEYEINVSQMENLPYYFSGEVILKFEDEIAVVTWDENAGWRDHFSLYIGQTSLYSPTSTLVKWNVSRVKTWQDCINQKLFSAHVYSQNETPHVVKLNFGNMVVFIGDSSEMRLGDGDDILIASELEANYLYGKWDIIWEAFS